jgi:hypothetical protein
LCATDRMMRRQLPKIDFLLNTNMPSEPKMISGAALHEGLRIAVSGPFSRSAFFDPGSVGSLLDGEGVSPAYGRSESRVVSRLRSRGK